MNNLIKFRAWNKKLKVMGSVDCLYFIPFTKKRRGGIDALVSEFENEIWHSEDIIIQQYSGSKDSEGKEIFEGDLVYHTGSILEVKMGVYYICGDGYETESMHGWLASEQMGMTIMYNTPLIEIASECRVIGNIFQNKIKKTKKEKK